MPELDPIRQDISRALTDDWTYGNSLHRINSLVKLEQYKRLMHSAVEHIYENFSRDIFGRVSPIQELRESNIASELNQLHHMAIAEVA